ncbi:hypothetical protein POM88_013984 [Heracleum sosnowskyi]|uniref:Uncharacterized protein n=1 Tax=Heracleum sosnowskyi TaxID=360622 RepID=A0AAD8J0W2_9APIA|nr:hypothetical protein POM88_013984 [Heracleum sosnowskyi]
MEMKILQRVTSFQHKSVSAKKGMLVNSELLKAPGLKPEELVKVRKERLFFSVHEKTFDLQMCNPCFFPILDQIITLLSTNVGYEKSTEDDVYSIAESFISFKFSEYLQVAIEDGG